MFYKSVFLMFGLLLSAVSEAHVWAMADRPIHTLSEERDSTTAQVELSGSDIQVGPRPGYLIDQLSEGKLKNKLSGCLDKPVRQTTFSIAHRGAPLMFPEHTRESYVAASRMGAGIQECDVTFTSDRELVCRHSQCDLHTTTNILETPLAVKCTLPFTPADPETGTPATARCCTSDITLTEFRTLDGKMDAADTNALTVEQYLGGTADFRTDLYATRGTLLTHAESIALFQSLGARMTPELKSPSVPMPFEGTYTQEMYAQQMIDEYKDAGVAPQDVWPQSFNYDDVLYWIQQEPAFGAQAVFLDARVYNDPNFVPTAVDFRSKKADGVNYIAPPMFALLELNQYGDIAPSDYARLARRERLDIITWTIERSGRIVEDVLRGGNTFYYGSTLDALSNDGDIYVTLDVLARQVGVSGVFSDWPATVSYYASCFDLK